VSNPGNSGITQLTNSKKKGKVLRKWGAGPAWFTSSQGRGKTKPNSPLEAKHKPTKFGGKTNNWGHSTCPEKKGTKEGGKEGASKGKAWG